MEKYLITGALLAACVTIYAHIAGLPDDNEMHSYAELHASP